MSLEGQQVERKSLRALLGRSPDWDGVARSCVGFANGEGGRLLLGIEDGDNLPPADQRVPEGLADQVRRRVGELTVNVHIVPTIETAENGGEFVAVAVSRSAGVASTSDGRYFIRVADTCVPVVGDEVLRLMNERPGLPWEARASGDARISADPDKSARFVAGIRASERVKASVKEKNPEELLSHYGLAGGGSLTCLGALIVGTAPSRRALGTAPIVQAIKYDEQGQKINKWTWDDCLLSPVELVDAIWRELPDFRESYELPEGMHRRPVPAYDEKVVRELLVNALVHRPYTQQGDIYLNLYPDRLEVVNPGRLPLGVTPRNILHASRRRNEGLARVFHDLGLMEREGSGFDLVYDRLLSQGRPAPLAEEGPDWVKVTIERRILKPEVIGLIEQADGRFQLTQRERITLGALAQTEGLTKQQLGLALETEGPIALGSWLGRLPALGLVRVAGRTRGARYYVDPALLRGSGVRIPTSLRRIEPHRLAELIREDLSRYPRSKIGEINGRVGTEVGRSQLKRALAGLARAGVVAMDGQRNAARYRLSGTL
jgi:ATP-dependent DNA helicase RecG